MFLTRPSLGSHKKQVALLLIPDYIVGIGWGRGYLQRRAYVLARKYRIHIFLALLALVIIFYPSYIRKPDQQRLEASGEAASRFLTLVDQGKYRESWDGCAEYLKDTVPLAQWQEQLAAVRSTAGPLKDRKQTNYVYTKEAKKGVPEGEYMVYTYSSSFANKADVGETVTLLLAPDGIWRVAGYFIE